MDSDGDGTSDICDLCMGDDAFGDQDMDGICDDLDPDCTGDVIVIQNIQYSTATEVRASQTISTGDNDVVVLAGADVTFSAGNSITLGKGFEVRANALFAAYIEGCQTALGEENEINPNQKLQIYHSKANNQTFIVYLLDEPSFVRLDLFDQEGNTIAQPVNESRQKSGTFVLRMNPNEDMGKVHRIVLQTNEGTLTKRMGIYQ